MLPISLVLAAVSLAPGAASPVTGVPDTPFTQEYHEAFPLPEGQDAHVRAIAVDAAGAVWIATRDGLFSLQEGQWTPPAGEPIGSAYALLPQADGALLAGAWNGLYEIRDQSVTKLPGMEDPLSALAESNQAFYAFGPIRSWTNRSGAWESLANRWAGSVTQALPDGGGGIYLCTGNALYHWHADDTVTAIDSEQEIISTALRGAVRDGEGRFWFGGLGGISVYREGAEQWRFPGHQPLPSREITCLAVAPDGVVWAGSALGAMRWTGERWSLRHSQRWLLSDTVNAIAFDAEGTAWIGTANGVSAIKRREMSLAQKAGEIYAKTMARHIRPPYIVEQCVLERPGDLSTWAPMDDDNDGGYTCVYMVMESFRYAATGDPDAQKKARKAFDTSVFLREVTGAAGFIARTVVPADWTQVHDPNETIAPQEGADRLVDDPRRKQVDVRWRPSADGKWLWKGDTSSDEIVAHFWGAYMYYELAADDAEKARVRDHVQKLMDYIIDGGLLLRDIDGQPTRWGVWAPEYLRGNADWRNEAPINCTEILSFLQVTHHVTGDSNYADLIQKLEAEHGYAQQTRRPFAEHFCAATHIDTELLAMVWPGLIQQAVSAELGAYYREGLDRWMARTRDELSPYFNFTYGALTASADFRLDDCVDFLRQCPLDLRHWTVDNTRREDLQLVRAPLAELFQTSVLLPPDERNIMRWDKNPWSAIDGNGATTESSGVYWLLPYWMGRYYGFIAAPESAPEAG
ncbi:MAG: regulator [Candidatus Hydrogenedentes bacterium]|nr:regulator [Candidatus Hydrogenedentota bacterium]